MKYITLIVRIFLLPIKLVIDLIYGVRAPVIAGHSWYTKSNFLKMLKEAKDDKEDMVKSFEEWKENAEKRITAMQKQSWIVFKVKINCQEMTAWLKEQKLVNTAENREIYVSNKVQGFLSKAVID